MLPCMHKFHAPCIDVWLGTSPYCPMCKLSVRSGKFQMDTPVATRRALPRKREREAREGARTRGVGGGEGEGEGEAERHKQGTGRGKREIPGET